MSKKLIDLTGRTFGFLTVIERAVGFKGTARWVCRCSCGNTKIIISKHLRSGDTVSCGCYQIKRIKETKTTHGCSKDRLYAVWRNMRLRCLNPNRMDYKYYGGKGIKICNEWSGFNNFREWALANGYEQALTLDRINNNGNYEPSNCRFVTRIEQANNRRGNIKIDIDGENKSARDLSEELNININTMRYRVWQRHTKDKLLAPLRNTRRTADYYHAAR